MKKNVQIFLLFALFPICSMAERPVDTGTILGSKTFGNWTVATVRFDDNVQMRALTKAEGQRADYILSFFLSQCTTYTNEVVIYADTVFNKDIDLSEAGTAKIRVDEKSTHFANVVNVVANLGENDMHVYMRTVGDNDLELMKDIMEGNKLRIKLEYNGSDPIFRFDLTGSDLALSYAMQQCQKYSDSQDDSEYFDDKKVNHDESFF